MATPQSQESATPYSMTIYVAAPGTPIQYEDGRIEHSRPGHLYWAISDGNTTSGFGFGPQTPGETNGPGKISRYDHDQ